MTTDGHPTQRAAAQEQRRSARVSTADLFEVATAKLLGPPVTALSPSMTVHGRALTVFTPAFDNLALHHAIAAAEPGVVLVVSVDRALEAGYWGELMTVAAQARGIAGLVIDGCVRDTQEIIALGFPVFSRGACVRGTSKRGGGSVGVDVVIGDASVAAGDWIVGDADGVIALSNSEYQQALVDAERRQSQETRTRQLLEDGQTTLEVFGLPPDSGH